MTEFSVNPNRLDPYKKFKVKWDGKYVAGVSKVTALKRTTEVIVWKLGANPESALANFRKDIIIDVFNEAEDFSYKVYRCWVSEYQDYQIWMLTRTLWPSSTSSSRTKDGNAILPLRSHKSRQKTNPANLGS